MTHHAHDLLRATTGLPAREVERLLLTASNRSRRWLIGDPVVDPVVVPRFQEMVARRLAGEPLQYIEGTVGFGPLELTIDRRALIPRVETEQLWEKAVAAVVGLTTPIIVDLCTGSGNLALALKAVVTESRVLATDISTDALSLAIENRERTGLQVEFLVGDLFDPLPQDLQGRVDLIVANPPYVAAGDVGSLPAEVREHEPLVALVADDDGTAMLGRIAAGAVAWLRPGGILACEIGEGQGDVVAGLFTDFDPRIIADLTGRPRFVMGAAPQMFDPG